VKQGLEDSLTGLTNNKVPALLAFASMSIGCTPVSEAVGPQDYVSVQQCWSSDQQSDRIAARLILYEYSNHYIMLDLVSLKCELRPEGPYVSERFFIPINDVSFTNIDELVGFHDREVIGNRTTPPPPLGNIILEYCIIAELKSPEDDIRNLKEMVITEVRDCEE